VPSDIVLSHDLPAPEELLALYDAVGWNAYTADPGRLSAAVAGSHLVLCAREASGSLIGLARTAG